MAKPVRRQATLSRRRSSGQRHSRPDRGLPEQLLAELLAVCLAAAKPYGADPQRVLAALSEADAQAPLARKLYRDTYWLGELATRWGESERYLDAAGRPKILSIHGPGATFEELVRKYFGKARVAQILELALSTHVVERAGRDRVLLRNPCVMLTGQPLLLLSRAVLCIRGLLASTENNALKASRRASLSPDRLACSVVSRDKYRQFADLMRPQLYNLADFGNRWLTQNAVRDRPRNDGGTRGLMGVHAYVFTD